MRFHLSFRYRVFLLGFLYVCSVVLLISLYIALHDHFGEKSTKLCYRKPINIPDLLDDVLDAPIQPTLGGSIFFHETKCRMQLKTPFESLNMANLTIRQACSVESAALHNPNSTVFVLFASPVLQLNDSSDKVMNAVLSYPNVQLRNLDLWRYTAGTPTYDWFKTDALFKSSHMTSHISDFLRYLTLWRYGGTYLDLDIVVLRSLEKLPPNFVGAVSNHLLTSSVMNFARFGIGHTVADYCLDSFQENFDRDNWANNERGPITRTLMHICQAHSVSEMFNPNRCNGFKVFQYDAFYAIHWSKWEHFFDKNLELNTINRLNNSYVTHLWNSLSEERKHLIGTPGAYGKLAAKHCPKVYASAGKYI